MPQSRSHGGQAANFCVAVKLGNGRQARKNRGREKTQKISGNRPLLSLPAMTNVNYQGRPGNGDFDFAPPNLNFYAGLSGMSWKRRSV